jgi:hypothetical protein
LKFLKSRGSQGILKGREISKNKYWGRQQIKFENPWYNDNKIRLFFRLTLDFWSLHFFTKLTSLMFDDWTHMHRKNASIQDFDRKNLHFTLQDLSLFLFYSHSLSLSLSRACATSHKTLKSQSLNKGETNLLKSGEITSMRVTSIFFKLYLTWGSRLPEWT